MQESFEERNKNTNNNQNLDRKAKIEAYKMKLKDLDSSKQNLLKYFQNSDVEECNKMSDDFYGHRKKLTFNELNSSNIFQVMMDYGCKSISSLFFKFFTLNFKITESIYKIFISNGCDINVRNYLGNTVLLAAASNINLESCTFLVEKGFDINAENHKGETPLVIAGKRGFRPLIDYFIKNGGKPSDKFKYMPYPVTSKDYLEALQVYEGIIAPIDYPDEDGNTALHLAALHITEQENATVDFLLKNTTNINIRNKDGMSPYGVACKCMNKGVIMSIMSYSSSKGISLLDGQPNSMFLMIKSDAIQFIKMLKGSKFQRELNKEYQNPLIYAAMLDKTDIFMILADDYESRLNEIDYDERTALHYACINHNRKIVDYLISHGCKENMPDYSNKTPLNYWNYK